METPCLMQQLSEGRLQDHALPFICSQSRPGNLLMSPCGPVPVGIICRHCQQQLAISFLQLQCWTCGGLMRNSIIIPKPKLCLKYISALPSCFCLERRQLYADGNQTGRLLGALCIPRPESQPLQQEKMQVLASICRADFESKPVITNALS